MSVTIKNRWVILALALLLIGAILLGWKIGRSIGDRASMETISTLNGIIKEYVIDINGLKKQVSERQQLILSQNQAINAHLIDKSELKKLYFKSVNEVTSLKAQIAILKDSLSHTGVITIVEPCDSVGYSFPVIKLPFTFKDGNEHYTLSGAFTETGIMSVDLNVPVKLSVWTGKDKLTKDYKVVVTTSNPYVKITELESVKLDLPKPKRISIGGQVGYGVCKNGLSPYAGVGLSINLFSF